MKNIISFSGGKDSTAMLLLMIEKKYNIDDIVFCDTGKEFPQMYEHIKDVEKNIGIKITVLKHEKSFEYYAYEHIRKNKTVGYWWPNAMNRWCTTKFKTYMFDKYIKEKYKGEYIKKYIGIAYDEPNRIKKNFYYPLFENKITENDALKMCYERGYTWGGLYEIFSRVSCYLCPLQRITEAKKLYNNFPKLWDDIKSIEKKTMELSGKLGTWKIGVSTDELEKRFKLENEQIELFEV